jgi:glycosyltransferase involved in cell wall biosynthesis
MPAKKKSPKKSQAQSLGIIIPAYNEEKRISETLQEYVKFYKENLKGDFEILVVTNGCKDKTADVVTKFGQKHQEIKLHDIPEAVGKGAAVTKGIELLGTEQIGYVDADNSASPEEFFKLYKELLDIDGEGLICGSRYIKGSKLGQKSVFRKFISAGFLLYRRVLFNIKVKDTQCGAKIGTGSMLKRILPNLVIADMAYDVNLIIDAKNSGAVIKEVPIAWNDKDGSTITSPWKTSLGMALSLLRLRVIRSPLKPYFRFVEPFAQKVYKWLK